MNQNVFRVRIAVFNITFLNVCRPRTVLIYISISFFYWSNMVSRLVKTKPENTCIEVGVTAVSRFKFKGSKYALNTSWFPLGLKMGDRSLVRGKSGNFDKTKIREFYPKYWKNLEILTLENENKYWKSGKFGSQ